MSELTNGIKQTMIDLAADAKAANDDAFEKKCLAAAKRCDYPVVAREGEKLKIAYSNSTAAFELAKFILI